MPTETQAPSDPVRAELNRYGDRLLPGAAERLAAVWKPLGNMPPAELANAVATRLEEKPAARFLNPEHKPPTMPNGQPLAPLRQALDRYSDQIDQASRDALLKRWSVDAAGLSPGAVARMVVSRLAKPEYAAFVKHPAAPLSGAQKHMDLIEAHFPEVPSENRRALAEELSRRPGGRVRASDTTTVRFIASVLSVPPVGKRFTSSGNPLATDDERRTFTESRAMATVQALASSIAQP